jgi:hypothetical protein
VFMLPMTTTTFDHIDYVLELCAHVEMVRANAITNVTSMVHLQAARDGAVLKFPRHPMGVAVFVARTAKASIPVEIHSAAPQPTTLSFLYRGLETVATRCVMRWTSLRTPRQLPRTRRGASHNAGALGGKHRGAHKTCFAHTTNQLYTMKRRPVVAP